MENLKIQDDKQLSQEELLKRVELMEKDMDKIIKTLENKFMWELNLNAMEMLRELKSIQKQDISND